MKNTKIMWVILLFVFTLIISGCTSESAGTTSKENNSNSKEEKVSTSLVVALAQEPTTLLGSTTPVSSTSEIIRNITSRLIGYDGKGNFVPMLATEWKNIDEHTWEFKLREGVKFTNGAPFNAESVKYTMDFMLNPDNKSLYGSRWMKELKEFRVIDEYTFQLITVKPNPSLLHRVVTDFMPIEPGYVEQVGIEEAGKKPIGVGAYKLVEWKSGEYIKLEANEDYWEGAPEIKDVTITFIPEFSSRLSALLSGEVDLIKSVPVDSMERVEADENSKIISALTGKPTFVGLSTFKDSPLRDVKVRQALNYAIDVDSLIKNVMNGKAQKLTGTLTPFNASYIKMEGYKYNPEKAKELLKEAGYEPGEITLKFETTNGYFPMDSQVTQAIAGELEKIGIKVEVVQHETGIFVQKVTSQNMENMFYYHTAASTEAESFYSFFMSPTGTYRFHNNPELLEEVAATFPIFNQQERQEAMAGIQRKLSDEAVIIPLWVGEDIWGARKDISFEPTFNEMLEIHNIKRGQ
ncbi:ABC transporter substrate-binding protein [Neobacillus niacini]|uniref:ABC transporter substrate-binding protein n=1 Tax=Neobacillus niacini TaxID=86668 RepID=UPI00300073A9